jgi:hypothetical protein
MTTRSVRPRRPPLGAGPLVVREEVRRGTDQSGTDLAHGEVDRPGFRAQDLVPELEVLAESHPYHEPSYRQFMLALYRSGRQSEALAAFRRARSLPADGLGIEPGPDLRRMERAILRQDPELEQPGAAHPQPPRPPGSTPSGSPPGPPAAAGRRPHRRRALIAGLAFVVACASVIPR